MKLSRWGGLFVPLSASLTLLVSRAHAAPCTEVSGSFVSSALKGGTESLRAEIEKDLSAELARDNILVCAADGSPAKPVAKIEIVIEAGSADIRIEDSLTSKAVSRRVPVPVAPEDVVALTLALATDELLRASWAELAFKNATPVTPPPKPVVPPPPVPLPPPAPPERPMNELGARAVYAWYSIGQSWLGADVYYRRELVSFMDVEVSGLARGGIPVESTHGQVDAIAIGGGAAFGFWPFRPGAFRFGASVGVDAAYVSLRGQADPGAREGDVDGAAVSLRGALGASVDASPIRVSAEVGAGAPVVGLEGVDEGEVVSGMSNAMIRTHLGMGVLF